MGGMFYDLGRRLGRATVPAIRKGRWIWNGLTGTEEEALRAEQALGVALAVEVRSMVGGGGDREAENLVQNLCRELARTTGDPRRVFRAEVIRSESPNAMALPGGFLFVSLDLVELCERRPDELAFVLGHEMAHVLLGHAWDRVLNQGLLRAASVVAGRAGLAGTWVRQQGLQSLQSAHSRKGEFEADERGCELAALAGYDPAGACSLLRRLEARSNPPGLLGPYFASHPPAGERAARLERGPRQG
jgi:beta-barrel assembly-enhancing protease